MPDGAGLKFLNRHVAENLFFVLVSTNGVVIAICQERAVSLQRNWSVKSPASCLQVIGRFGANTSFFDCK